MQQQQALVRHGAGRRRDERIVVPVSKEIQQEESMSIEVKVPQLPESVADATLVAWHKSPGDKVSRDENLADLETDKVVLEVPAPTDGVLKEIRITDGTTVTAGEILAIIEAGAGALRALRARRSRGRDCGESRGGGRGR
jgi:pyruvate/2-oxoglutarate dehydrogenase complex dihydrolipoamide acyltransferase (E2) component